MVVVYAFSSADGGFTLDNFTRMGTYAVVFGRSFKLAIIATVICACSSAIPSPTMMAREGPRFQRVAMVLIMLPMWMNFLLRTYSWMSILENNGLLNQLFPETSGPHRRCYNQHRHGPSADPAAYAPMTYFRMINTQGAVVLGMVYNYLPFMILPIYSVIVKLDHSLLEAARDLGANSFHVFRRVILPLSPARRALRHHHGVRPLGVHLRHQHHAGRRQRRCCWAISLSSSSWAAPTIPSWARPSPW